MLITAAENQTWSMEPFRFDEWTLITQTLVIVWATLSCFDFLMLAQFLLEVRSVSFVNNRETTSRWTKIVVLLWWLELANGFVFK